MNTPIVEFVSRYAQSDASRLHMPGHKGVSFLGVEHLDITEIDGADVLYGAEEIIAESEANATKLFGTAHTFYSTAGSSLAISAMLALVTGERSAGERPVIFAARNVHRSFIHACALLDLDVEWIYPRERQHLCSCTVEAETLDRMLKTAKAMPRAVYVTSPDYLGQTADIASIANVCHAHGVPLCVDNAHGAYLNFLSPSRHPIALGADLCADSAHKTLPVLTGGAYLHVSKNADPTYVKSARDRLALFASTSPSYLILQSLDLCNRYLAADYPSRLDACIKRVDLAKERIAARGVAVLPSEPLKVVVCASDLGYSGRALAEHLRAYRVEAEFYDATHLVLMITPETSERDFVRLEAAFDSITPRAPIQNDIPALVQGERAMTIREAVFAPHETVTLDDAIGRVCASPTVSCPPAVPIAICGERITEDTVKVMQHYGFETISVVT